jgi:hypothetical protein
MRYIVTGRVHPERADIRFGPIQWQIPGEGQVTTKCDSSQISIVLELASLDNWGNAYFAAEHFAVMVIGALGFSLGSGYSIELIQVIEEDGTPNVVGVRPTGETPDQTLGFSPHDPIFFRSFQLANQSVFFRLALRDYLRGLNDTTDCATYCFRAIESIKSAFIFKTGKDRWDDMHAALGTDRATINATVKDFADPVRHGNWVNAPQIDGNTRWQMLLLTRNILMKFLDHEMPAA